MAFQLALVAFTSEKSRLVELMQLGFHAVHAVPLRLRGDVLGTLNLFLDHPGSLTPDDASVTQGLADVATIGILQERAARASEITKLDMNTAFTTLRQCARSNNLALRDVAESVVNKTLSI